MTVSTPKTRLVAFLFVIVTGAVWNSIGATAATATTTLAANSAFGPETFLPRQPAFSRPLSLASSKLSLESDSSSLFRLRGGEISIPDEDEDGSSSLIATKLRNVIRNILRISDDKVPLFSVFLRACFKSIGGITGIDLLAPAEETESSSSESKSKRSKSSKSKSKKKNSDKVNSETETAETTKQKKKKPSKKVSAATQKHLASTIKSNNPNYRIQKELKAFLKSPPDNLSVQVGSNIRLWIVTIVGAKGTIYEGEIFKLRVEFPKDYPTVPPSAYFLKKFMPLHEHVYTNGDICLSLLGNGWRPNMSAQSIAVSILSILSSSQKKCLPMDNAGHAGAKPGKFQKDWVYHDDNC